MFHTLYANAVQLVRDAVRVSLDLFKIMVPIIIAVKALKELGLIQYLAVPLAPCMELVGLPAQTGLVWATAMAVNLYSAIVVYAALAPDTALSVAQVTVLSVMLLIAHNLPVELKIAQKAGAGLWSQALIRVAGALVAGLLLHAALAGGGWLQEPSAMLWQPPEQAGGLAAWAWGQAQGLASLFLVILGLLALMRVLAALRVTDFFNWALRPLLRLMGIGKSAATVTVIGLTMGIAYGGGLIIHESRTGTVTRQDMVSSLTLMGLSHALIEDTLLMMLLGASTIGTFWYRLAFSLLAMALLTRVFGRLLHAKPRAQAAG